MILRVSIEYGDYDYSEDMERENGYGKIWISSIKKILELTPYEIEKHRNFEEANRMFLLTLKQLHKEANVLLPRTNNIRK